MGLDITAYKNLTHAPDAEVDSDGYPVGDHYRPGPSADWSEKHFPGRAEGLNTALIYAYEDLMRFRAGSYSGYNLWRNVLAQLAGFDSAAQVHELESPSGPFVELINFADNEGVIGPVVSAKLAKDFADNQSKADEYAKEIGDGEWWLDRYANWREAFEMAQHGGAVDFH